MDISSFFISGMSLILLIFLMLFIALSRNYSKSSLIIIIISITSVIASITFSFLILYFSSGENWTLVPPTATITAPDNRLVYTVHVKESVSLEPVANSQVIIEVDGEAAIIKATDSNGLSVLVVDSSFAGQTGSLIVERPGYEVYIQDVELTVGGLPEIVELKPKP